MSTLAGKMEEMVEVILDATENSGGTSVEENRPTVAAACFNSGNTNTDFKLQFDDIVSAGEKEPKSKKKKDRVVNVPIPYATVDDEDYYSAAATIILILFGFYVIISECLLKPSA